MHIEVYDIKWEVDDVDHDLPGEEWIRDAYPDNYRLTYDEEMNIINEVADNWGYPIEDAKIMCHNEKGGHTY